MKRPAWLVVVCLCAVNWPLAAVGQPPDLLRNYRFVPRFSTLDVSGGFAGFDLELPIHGTFGLVTGYRYTEDSPSVIPGFERYAKFIDVDAQAINPTDFGPYSFDLDDTLNLSGLRGAPGPLMLPLENWLFRGVDSQEVPMSLYAIEVGRWLVMFGSNDPPCCDIFDFEITAVARQVPFADFDDDGDSDRDDLTRLAANMGLASGALLEQGDSDGDGDVDGRDFLNLQRDQGDTAEAALALATGAAASATHAVPEPASCLLALVGAVSILLRRRPLLLNRFAVIISRTASS